VVIPALSFCPRGKLMRTTSDAEDPDAVIGIKPQITLLPANPIPVTLQRR
jgi:hypothetical protein